MIDFQSVTKRYGPQVVLETASFRVNPSERIGIVGPNGGGKTTIFGLITGSILPDKGEVVLPKQVRLGHVHQHIGQDSRDQTLIGYAEHSLPPLQEIVRQLEDCERQLHHPGTDRSKVVERMGTLQAEYEHLGGYEMRSRAEATLCGLGFSPAELEHPFSNFSGGWKMRAELARILIGQPDTLLLDEPSNYLDIPAVEWLRRFLRSFTGTLLLISHDRYLLESLTEITLEVRASQVIRYAGPYSYYERERETRRTQLEAARSSQDRKLAQMERFVERFRAKNTKASQVQSRIKMMDRVDRIEVPAEGPDLSRIRIAAPPHCGSEIVRLESMEHSYDGENWIFRGVDLAIQRGEKIALVGYNGMGKTTLLRILSGALEATVGKRVLGHQVVVGYQSQDFAETMPPEWSAYYIIKQAGGNATDKEIRNLLGTFGFSGEATDKPCSILSGGEKIRLAFARIFIQPPNFLVLDEPTTHLDINGRQALETALTEYKGTVLLVSHDIEFVRNVADQILAMTPPSVTRYHGGYDYYREKSDSGDIAAISKPGSLPSTATNKKSIRKERARVREAQRDKENSLKAKLRKAEKEIETLEKEQATLAHRLENETGVNFESINRRLQQIQYELDIATTAWEKAVEDLAE